GQGAGGESGFHQRGRGHALVAAGEIIFGDLGDVGHRVDGDDGKFSDAGFTAEHDGVGTVENSVGDIADFGARRGALLDHALEHLRGDDDRLTGALAAADEVLLDDGNQRHVHLDPQIAARDHEAVAGVDDFVDVIDSLGFLNLGDEMDVADLVLQV